MNNILFSTSIALSLLSQLPIFLESGASDYMKMFWLVPALVIIPQTLKSLSNGNIRIFLLFVIIFFLYCFLLEAFQNIKYIGADLNNILISFFIFTVSFCYFKLNHSQKDINIICFVLLTVSGIVAFIIYTSASLVSTLDEAIYAYNNKNSMGQILLSNIIFCSFMYKLDKKWLILFKWLAIVFIIVVMFLLKSRSTILGFFFVILYFVFSQKYLKYRFYLFGFLFVSVLIVLNSRSMYEMLVENILFANQDVTDINALSSSRVDRYPFYISGFMQSPLIGNGNRYFDCMPLIMLYQYGILGTSIVFLFILKMYISINKIKNDTILNLSAYLLLCVFLINSLFEAQPPFGPGIKCFLLWMTMGFSFSNMFKCKSI